MDNMDLDDDVVVAAGGCGLDVIATRTLKVDYDLLDNLSL
jgi:hypothetical protein